MQANDKIDRALQDGFYLVGYVPYLSGIGHLRYLTSNLGVIAFTLFFLLFGLERIWKWIRRSPLARRNDVERRALRGDEVYVDRQSKDHTRQPPLLMAASLYPRNVFGSIKENVTGGIDSTFLAYSNRSSAFIQSSSSLGIHDAGYVDTLRKPENAVILDDLVGPEASERFSVVSELSGFSSLHRSPLRASTPPPVMYLQRSNRSASQAAESSSSFASP